MDDLSRIRAQRAEVEALLSFRHAAESEARVVAWWRLHGARRARLRGLPAGEAARLPPLPAPPEGAFSAWQRLRLRMGLLRLESATPPRAVAHALTGRRTA
jgi:hypothetical protein